jgi:hypothetical protein
MIKRNRWILLRLALKQIDSKSQQNSGLLKRRVKQIPDDT